MEFARTVRWNWEGTEILLGVEEAGSGPSVVLLPALSSISTRAEMRPLFDRLVSEFRAVMVDRPGFGDVVRPQADTTPDSLSAFLNWFLSDVLSPPHMAVAAGHAATYALYQAVHWPGTINRLVLLAPTWRGPLPTMIGSRRPWFTRVQSAVDHQSIGPLLYRLNVSSSVIKKWRASMFTAIPTGLPEIASRRNWASLEHPALTTPPFASSPAFLIAW